MVAPHVADEEASAFKAARNEGERAGIDQQYVYHRHHRAYRASWRA